MRDYINMESKYISAIKQFCSDSGVDSLDIVDIEYQQCDDIIDDNLPVLIVDRFVNGQRIELISIDDTIKYILRENLWCKLKSNGTIEIHFGYDYYVYIQSICNCIDAINFTRSIGLYVESHKSPYV